MILRYLKLKLKYSQINLKFRINMDEKKYWTSIRLYNNYTWKQNHTAYGGLVVTCLDFGVRNTDSNPTWATCICFFVPTITQYWKIAVSISGNNGTGFFTYICWDQKQELALTSLSQRLLWQITSVRCWFSCKSEQVKMAHVFKEIYHCHVYKSHYILYLVSLSKFEIRCHCL